VPDLSQSPWSEFISFLQDVVIPVLLILVVVGLALRGAELFVQRAVRAVLDREAGEGTAIELSALEVQKRVDTLDNLAIGVIRGFVVVIGGLMILGQIGLDIGPAIAGLGVVGIAVGFGAQSLVRDYFNGALVLLENQYSIGDIVELAGVSGVVEGFTLRRTTLRDLSGVVHTVPNGEIHVASNMTRIWARVNEHVQVAYGTDIPTAIAVIEDVGLAMKAEPAFERTILEPPAVLRVESLDDSGVTLKILATVRAGEQWTVAGELRKRLLAAFAERGIEIPFPHRVMVSPPSPGPSPTPDGRAAAAPLPGDALAGSSPAPTPDEPGPAAEEHEYGVRRD
jgi:small conductance mechanosensitive channel